MKNQIKQVVLTTLVFCMVLLGGCGDPVAVIIDNGGDDTDWTLIDVPVSEGIEPDWDAYNGRIISVDPSVAFQEMVGFSAADAWVGAFVGGLWNEPVKEQIADWLFSQEFDDKGQVKGIGLSMWRVNLGAGSWEQGRNSRISGRPGITQLEDGGGLQWGFTRRSESYLANVQQAKQTPGTEINPLFGNALFSISQTTDIWTSPLSGITYDWAKCSGHQYWMRAAKQRGVQHLVAAVFSPVVAWTRSGTGNNVQPDSVYNNGYVFLDWAGNLTETGYTEYADYVADVADYFANPARNVIGPDGLPKSLRFDYISPVNEPNFDWWYDNQEGSPWYNENTARLSKSIQRAVQDPGRTHINTDNTKLLLAEAGAWHLVYALNGMNSNHIEAFFNPANTASYMGDQPMMPRVIAGHSYATHENDVFMIQHREALRAKTREFNIEAWNTEWCALHLGEDVQHGQPWQLALFMAKLIHADLTIGELASWSFWTSMDIESTLQNYYNLVGVSPGTTVYDPLAFDRVGNFMTNSGTAKSQSNMWTLGNYSLFIRPGFRRINVTPENFFDFNLNDPQTMNHPQGLMVSAYQSPDNFTDYLGNPVNRIVVVYVNWLNQDRLMAVNFTDDRKPTMIRCYVTTEGNTNSHPDGRDEGKMGMRRVAHENGAYTVPRKSVFTVVYDFPVN